MDRTQISRREEYPQSRFSIAHLMIDGSYCEPVLFLGGNHDSNLFTMSALSFAIVNNGIEPTSSEERCAQDDPVSNELLDKVVSEVCVCKKHLITRLSIGG